MAKIEYGTLRDNELVEYIKKKDSTSEKAFAEVYSRYSQRVYAYALRIPGSRTDAKDCFQEVFIRFYEKISQKKADGSLISYLLTIDRNYYLSKKKDEKLVLKIDESEIFTPTFEDNSIEQKELERILPEALMKLKYHERELIILRVYEGLSYNEIEKITGVHNGNLLRNRFHRSREKLRNILSVYFK